MPAEELEIPGQKLHAQECHLWHIPLVPPDENNPVRMEYLSDEEKTRAAKFLLPAPRHQFVTTRSVLRALLGTYLKTHPARIPFAFNTFGKPFLPAPLAELRFNVSHSGQQALIAITKAGEVGVDIEQQRGDNDILGLAKMIFCPEDLQVWLELPPLEQRPAFYDAWSRKEALSKALGFGLSVDLKVLRVNFNAGDRARILEMDQALGLANQWQLKQIDRLCGYSAALAINVQDIEVKHLTFHW